MTHLPWLIAPDELLTLRGHGGQRFADFVSALLRAEAALGGLKIDDIDTNTRVTIPDGGVDAEVKVPLGGPLEIIEPSCWQFKATSFAEISAGDLQKEANKREAKRLIEAGYRYLVCVCDDSASLKIGALNKALLATVHAINPLAPIPHVLTVGQLADWASRHPSIVLAFFRQNLSEALAYAPWLKKERSSLPQFVELRSRADTVGRIREHAGEAATARPVLTLAGPVGAGISRLVAEALSPVAPRVIYAPDSTAAVGLITSLMNQPLATGILVLDRCPISVRQSVEELLLAETHRFRVVAIHDPTEMTSAATLRVPKLDDADVQTIIDTNFKDLPSSHRRAFVHFADGIPKIAGALATAYAMDRSKFLVDSASWAQDQLSRHVPDPADWRVLRALSVFARVGYLGDVSGQLGVVCGMFGLEPKDVLRRARRLSDAQGVVAIGARYLSVRPRLFARALFEGAWDQMADLSQLMADLPYPLRSSLLKQAGQHAHKAAREALADWATPWLRTLQPGAISSADIVAQLLPLVDVNPSRIGPIFLDLVANASDEVARSPGAHFDRWPARQHVLWKLTQLLERRDTYFLAELALFRLARVEDSSESVGRNLPPATERWSASFRLHLSGTEVSFPERLAVLVSRLDSLGEDAVQLITIALDSAVNEHGWKMEGTPVASGEVHPIDWQPSTYGELWECLDGAIGLLGRCLLSPVHGRKAFRVLWQHGRGMLRQGRLKQLRGAVENATLGEEERVKLFDLVGDYLQYDAKGSDKDYVEAVETWHKSLERHDLAGRLFEALSVGDRRAQLRDQEGWTSRIQGLANELFEQPALLHDLLSSVVSDAHHPGALFVLGAAIGHLDVSATFLLSTFSAAPEAKVLTFIEGYVSGLAQQGVAHDDSVRFEIDQLERNKPEIAVRLNGMNARIGSSGARALRLVRTGNLPAKFLTNIGAIWSQPELLVQALESLMDEPTEDTEANASAALDLLGYFAWDASRALPSDSPSLAAIWRVMETAAACGAHVHVHAWQALLRRLSEQDLGRAIQLACTAAATGHYSLRVEAVEELVHFAARDPISALKQLGPHLLDPQSRHAFLSTNDGDLVAVFPPDLIKRWVQENGVAGARAIAQYLERPSLGALADQAVPPLTEFILKTFEDDDVVFEDFCSTGHAPQIEAVDLAQFDLRAELLESFRTHPLRRIREWAEQEIASARGSARFWREHQEERFDE